jgi:hypothetical protein
MRDDVSNMTLTFEELQRSLIERMRGRGISDLDAGTIVVVPSISFPSSELRKIIAIERYEERLLCLLLLLDRAEVRMIYVTSLPIDDAVIDYYLSFLRDPASARRRLHLVSVGDESIRALTAKLLDHPEILVRIKELAGGPEEAYLLPFNVSDLEKSLSETLALPLYGPHPDLGALGHKSGGRQVARRAGVPVLEGSEDLWSAAEVADAIEVIKRARPGATHAVIKLNDGFSGQGNAIVRLDEVVSPLTSSAVTFCASEESWPSFESKIESSGAIVEELAHHEGVVSPSVQMRIAPGGALEIVSTHDQILGGPDDQVYLGCRFPAGAEYRNEIQDHAVRVAEVLSEQGVIGPFAIDFIVVPDGELAGVYLSEINLRMGGTTHPFLMARFATGAIYDAATGLLVKRGASKFYVATDNLKSPAYVGLGPSQVIDAVVEAGVAFDHETRTGVMIHLLGAVERYGKLGILCVGDSAAHADRLYAATLAALDDAADRPT